MRHRLEMGLFIRKEMRRGHMRDVLLGQDAQTWWGRKRKKFQATQRLSPWELGLPSVDMKNSGSEMG